MHVMCPHRRRRRRKKKFFEKKEYLTKLLSNLLK